MSAELLRFCQRMCSLCKTMWISAIKQTAACVYLSIQRTRIFFPPVILLSSRCLSVWSFPGFAVTLDNLSRQRECRANDVMVDNELFVHLDWVGIARCASLQQLHTILYLWPYSTDNAHISLMLQQHFFFRKSLLFFSLLSRSTCPEQA